ncbi:MAG: hypothetical protein HY313_01250 [Acidobacteria bacterium]|nr:hypothetical protein [Acidobacteriota bacterium]
MRIHADIAGGWKRYKSSFGYWASGKEKLDNSLSVMVAVKIFGRRSHSAAELRELNTSHRIAAMLKAVRLERFPHELIHEFHDNAMNYRISGGVLEVYINLAGCEGDFSISEKGNPYLNWDHSIVFGDAVLEQTVNVVFITSVSRRPGDIKEWDTVFASAGLPSLGKRR